jgi:hypothetical protein
MSETAQHICTHGAAILGLLVLRLLFLFLLLVRGQLREPFVPVKQQRRVIHVQKHVVGDRMLGRHL